MCSFCLSCLGSQHLSSLPSDPSPSSPPPPPPPSLGIMDASTLSLTVQNQSSGSHSISLSCPVGKINYQNDEFLYYKYLYEAIDLDDDGRISFQDGNVFLMRSKVPKVDYLSSPPLPSSPPHLTTSHLKPNRKSCCELGALFPNIKMMILSWSSGCCCVKFLLTFNLIKMKPLIWR